MRFEVAFDAGTVAPPPVVRQLALRVVQITKACTPAHIHDRRLGEDEPFTAVASGVILTFEVKFAVSGELDCGVKCSAGCQELMEAESKTQRLSHYRSVVFA